MNFTAAGCGFHRHRARISPVNFTESLRIAAIINGTQVASVEDGTYRAGQLLLLVSHSASVPAIVEVRFDNLLVIKP